MCCRVSLVQNKTITLITGGYDSGKTTALLTFLEEKNYPSNHLCGFVSLAKAEKTCYRLKDLFSGEERLALDEQAIPSGRKQGRFFVDDAVFAWANQEIIDHLSLAKLAVFDEVGKFELEGRGFDPSFRGALATADLEIVATVRLSLLQEVIDHYALDRYTLIVLQV
jgi:nucleoside-triphosphatase THEP1